MEIPINIVYINVATWFKIDLIVWKLDIDDDIYVNKVLFKIDLIVWKLVELTTHNA